MPVDRVIYWSHSTPLTMRNLAILGSTSHKFPNSHISSAVYDIEANSTYILSETVEVDVDIEIFKFRDGEGEEVSKAAQMLSGS